MSKWKPISLAIDILVVTLPVMVIATSYGEVEAGWTDRGDIAWALFYMLAYTLSVIDLYKHFSGKDEK